MQILSLKPAFRVWKHNVDTVTWHFNALFENIYYGFVYSSLISEGVFD